jgi:arginyl-tRNA synthetase
MYKSIIKSDIQNYLTSKNITLTVDVSYSSFENFHYQTSILFQLNKKGDFDTASLIAYLLKTTHYENIEITGKAFLSFKMNLMNAQTVQTKPKETVVVDYCGVNVAKKMHIGHIRSMFIGDFVVRSHQNMGDEVISYNHVGDWGNQFGFLLNYIMKNDLANNLDNQKLTEYYKLAYTAYNLSKESDDNSFALESDNVAYKLQNKLDDELLALWQKCVDISLIDLEDTIKEFKLKLTIADTKGESFFAQFCHEIVEDLINKQIASVDENGSVYVQLENNKLVIKKTNGTFLYALYDLAAIKWRVEQHNPDKIVYVVDKRQSLHFETIFMIAKKAGYATDKNKLIHLGFGTILGEDNKPIKTKTGKSLYLDDLLMEGKNELLKSTHFTKLSGEIQTELLNKTIVGGLKFHDLKLSKHQDYVFDWKHVLNFSGGSAPYIQNAYVRIDSILFKKYDMNEPKLTITDTMILNNQENCLFFNVLKTQEIINEMSAEYQSHYLTTQLVSLCTLFHKYYESEKILGHEEEYKKLCLIAAVKDVIEKGCNILGIETYPCLSKMTAKNKI